MGLQADISVKIDTGGLISTLGGKIAGFKGSLDGISVPPIDVDAFRDAALGTSGLGGGLTGSVGSVAAQLPSIVERLPLPTDALGPVRAVLDLVESLASADLETKFKNLGDSLAGEFSGTSDEGFLGILLKIADLFGNSSQVGEWKALVERIGSLAGVRLPEQGLAAPNLVPGAAAAIRLLGGLMAEFTVISETGRLAKAAAGQIDADAIAKSTAALTGFFEGGGPTLAQLIASTNPADAAQVDVAVAAVKQMRLRLDHWGSEVSRRLAFGEATLVFMNLPGAQRDLDYAAQILRQADADALRRLLDSAARALGSVVPPEALSGPQFTLDEFFTQVEGRIGQIAAKISALDASAISGPLTSGLNIALDIPNRLGEAIEQVKLAISGALEQVRAAIAALPLDAIRNVITDVLGALTRAIQVIGDLVTAIKNLLETAANTIKTVLGTADQALTDFRDAVKALLHDAVQFVEGLHLEQVVGAVADGAQQLAGAIAKASMKPYFDTAASAIDTATGVIEKVPFDLLPDSMEQEVVDALRPIKTADVGALQTEIESLLQIGPDGKFTLRPEIEKAVAEVQKKFDDLIAEIRARNPRAALAAVDAQLAAFGEKVRQLSLQVDLTPVRNAIQEVRSAAQAMDPNIVLQPLRDGFNQVLAKIEEYAPEKLIEPVEQRWNAALQKVMDLSRLKQWKKLLDDLAAEATKALDLVDPAQFGPNFDAALTDALATLDRLPQLHAGSAFGSVIATIYHGSRLRVLPLSFEPVLEWMGGATGAAGGDDLRGRTESAVEALQKCDQTLDQVDLPGVMARLGQGFQSVRSAALGIQAGAGRDRITAELDLVDLARALGPLQANQQRFFEVLKRTTNEIAQLSAAGFSEVDDGVRRLKEAWQPMQPVNTALTGTFGRLGITGFDVGLGEVVRRLVALAPPSRIVALLTPLFTAVHDRVKAFIDAIANPLRAAIQRLIDILESLSLTPLKDGLKAIHLAVVAQIKPFHPDQLLAEPLAAFTTVRNQVIAFDPVKDIQAIIEAVAKAVETVLKKLNVEELLAEPLALYDKILELISSLKPGDLLVPVLDQLDRVAEEVDQGLTRTVDAFRGLQDALPDQVGSTSLSASASVSVS
jgi:hypothetical protein